MSDNQKIDNELNLALDVNRRELLKSPILSTGYNEEEDTWEVIVKYNGDIIAVGEKYNARTEILTDQYAIMTIDADDMDDLASEDQVEYVEKPKNYVLELDAALYEACVENVHNFPQYNLRGDGVLIGVIDSGIDYTHPDFINDDGTTRIAYIWDQTIEGNPPEGFLRGTEYTREQINEALSKPTRDEKLQVVPSMDIVGHGTGVAGVAGGNGRASDGRYIGAAPEAEFIIVKMGQTGFESFAKNTEIMRALKYVIEKAKEMNKPIAVNLSYGNNDGSHDGSSIFEEYIDNWANRWKNVIVVGTGNEGISGKHTSGFLNTGDIRDVEVFISENERGVNFQIWKEYEDDIEIELIAPSGQSTGFIKQLLGTQKFRIDFTDILLYYGKPSPFNKSQQIYIEMVPVDRVLSEGKWIIRLKANDVVTGRFDIWLPISYEVAKETSFAQPTTDTTLTIPSSTERVISVGAYNSAINSIAPFSGRGYTRTDNMVKPDLVAPGVMLTAAKTGGGYGSFTGTSFATPFVTGSAALLMQYGIIQENDPFLYGEKLKAFLISGARRDKPNLDYPNNVWGYGTLCLQNSLDVISRSASNFSRHEYNQTQETELPDLEVCHDIITSNEYIDVIREYYVESLEEDTKEYGAECYQLLNQRYAVFHIPLGEKTCDSAYKNIPFSQIPDVYGLAGMRSIKAAGILPVFTLTDMKLTGKDVIIGIIDTGIDYTHPVFIKDDGTTKIHSIWDQTEFGKPPEGYLYGAEYTEEQINEALRSENPFDIVPQRDDIGHGTFLSGVCAGKENKEVNFIGAAPNASLVVVKLKQIKECIRDYNLLSKDVPAYQSNDIILAIRYIIRKSTELNKPVALLFGGECNMVPHDGNSVLENYFDMLSKYDRLVNVVPSGNEADKGRHFRGILPVKTSASLKVKINVDNDEKGFVVVIWNSAPDKLSVGIQSPKGIDTKKIPFASFQKQEITITQERTEILVEYEIPEERTGDQATYIRFKNPSQGIWTITVYGELIVNGIVDCYLPSSGFVKKGTRFLDPDPYYTCTDPGTATNVITVGAFNDVSKSLYFPSGRGLSRSNIIKPDLVAPGVNVIGPLKDGGYGSMSGTSVAAAITAGACGLLLEWGIVNGNDPVMGTLGAKNNLVRGANRRDDLNYPNRDWGFGELNLLNTFELIDTKRG